ncbi:MAG: DUF2339 domain-containing protein [Myxococcales bacterium]|nr:DUF2339 domain-containing protein [Myxococcales bacterium]
MDGLEERLAQIEARLARIEGRLGDAAAAREAAGAAADRTDSGPYAGAARAAGAADATGPADSPGRAPGARPTVEIHPSASVSAPAARTRGLGTRAELTATRLMAWGASAAFILAAGYFVKLVYDAGWLTPARQVGLAGASGMALIGAGLGLSRFDRDYSAYLPAVGIVVLYLSIFAGHVFYGLFGLPAAFVGVAGVTLAALWLGRRFDHSAYALLAVTGTYATPLLVEAARTDVIDLVVYYSAWGLLFSFVALQERRRSIYLLALYFALFGFDIAFRLTDRSAWLAAVLYQLVQLLVFAGTAAFFSVRHRRPMTELEAVVHGLALFYFYGIEYSLLHRYAPGAAPWAALASVGVVLGLYEFARRQIGDPDRMRASGTLVSAYASIVTTHVVFFELLPDRWQGWAAMLLPASAGLLMRRGAGMSPAWWPVYATSGLVFAFGFFEVLTTEPEHTTTPMPELLIALHAASLYVAAMLFRRQREGLFVAPVLLYAGHLALLTATVRVLDEPVAISVVWAVIAVAMLLFAVRRDDRMVGQSSLVIFLASALKVLLYDLSDAAPAIRVVVLVVLAASLYAGGWLYQRMGAQDEELHPDRTINEQLNLIKRLFAEGRSAEEIARELTRRGVPQLDRDGVWTGEVVARIGGEFGFRGV